MKKFRLLSIVFFAFSAIGLNAQTVTQQEVTDYLSGPNQVISKAIVKFQEFDSAYKTRDAFATSSSLSSLKAEAIALSTIIYGLKPLQNETWYLPKAKEFTKKYNDLAYGRLDQIVTSLQKTGPTPYLDEMYQEAVNELTPFIEALTWAESLLMAKFLYAPSAESFCYASLLLAEDAQKDFEALNTGPMEGEENKFKVSDLPAGALDGYIYIASSERKVARFVMYRTEKKEEAYNAFVNMIYYLLACDHKEMEISTDKILPLEKVNPQYHNYPQFWYRPKDYTIPYRISLDMRDTTIDGKVVWEVYIEYFNLPDPNK